MSRTGTLGILKGMGVSPLRPSEYEMICTPEELKMDFADKNDEVYDNDEVVTSGLGGVYPEGLLVGSVIDMQMDASGLYQVLRVIPSADMMNLKYVFVVGKEKLPVDGKKGGK